jgi:hypothetical protein
MLAVLHFCYKFVKIRGVKITLNDIMIRVIRSCSSMVSLISSFDLQKYGMICIVLSHNAIFISDGEMMILGASCVDVVGLLSCCSCIFILCW